MIESLHFLNQTYVVHVIVGTFLVLIFFLWKEWTSPPQLRFYIHASIAFVSLLSLAMLLLKPALWTTKTTSAGVLLTDGYQKETLDSLKKKFKNLKVVSYKSNRPMGGILDSIDPIFLLGEGVNDFDFWQFENRQVDYLGADSVSGITQLNYQKKQVIGNMLSVKIRYRQPMKGHKVVLVDAGGRDLDSVLLENSNQTDFELSTPLKVSGNYVYELLEKDSLGKTILQDPLPVRVSPAVPLKLLMINSFPTFEAKYLKNFLAETGYEIRVRSQLTRGKYKFEYFNTDRRPFYSFSKELVESVDLLIIDANSYLNLSRKSKQLIELGIRDNGMGLFVLPNRGFFRRPQKTSNFEFVSNRKTKTNWNKWPRLSLEKFPFTFGNDIRLEEINRSENTLLTAYLRKGHGRFGTTVVQNSYQLVLDGNSDTYKQFWSEIVTDLSKRKGIGADLNASTPFAIQDEPFSFELRTSEQKPMISGENGRIPLRQDLDFSELWYGTTYPRTKGWQSFSFQNDSTLRNDFYVMDSTKWKSIRSFRTIVKNKRKFNGKVYRAAHKKSLEPVNSTWFFLIFVFGIGYLWVAPKIFSN